MMGMISMEIKGKIGGRTPANCFGGSAGSREGIGLVSDSAREWELSWVNAYMIG
jgi:hypothetical protein